MTQEENLREVTVQVTGFDLLEFAMLHPQLDTGNMFSAMLKHSTGAGHNNHKVVEDIKRLGLEEDFSEFLARRLKE